MALPMAAIDRLFERLQMTYGSEFLNKWSNLNAGEVKAHWAFELDMFTENLQAIAWALNNLPDRCPNLIEFKSLCKQAPKPTRNALEAPKAPVEVVDRVIAEIASKAFKTPRDESGKVDHKLWARKLLQRHKKGEALGLHQIKAYKAALEINE